MIRDTNPHSCRRFLIALALLVLVTAPGLAATMTGFVVDERGNPISEVDLDFEFSATGEEGNPDGDSTDITGQFESLIAPGVYDVFFSPPPGSRLAGHVEPNVNLNFDVNMTIVLKDAVIVSGKVMRTGGSPAVNADLDFENVITGEKIFTPRDNTGLDGVFGVAVPAGIYEVTYDGDPNVLPLLAPGFLEEISVDGSQDLVLPTVELPLGYTVTGEVLGEFGIAVQGADLDFVDSVTGRKLFTKNDKTSASGVYNVLVPAGTYNIEYMPPSGSNLASVVRADVVVAGNTFVPRIDMQPGRMVSGNVIDPDGRNLGAVDLELFSSSSGAVVPVADDDTDATGRYQVRMLDGTYDILYNPLRNSQVAADTNFAVSISGDTELATMILPWHDQDLDGFADVQDNCPHTVNGGQLDTDNDGVGDVCDNCPGVSNVRQEDNDLDRIGNACDPDDDNDGIADASDSDSDGDLVPNRNDNCPDLRNPSQRDVDSDGQGDACDPNDGLVENIVVSGDEEFTWRPETGASGYKVYRVSMRALSSINFGTCYHAAPEVPAMVADSDPDPGEGFVYIVTADMNGGEGSLGVGSSGEERPNLRACP